MNGANFTNKAQDALMQAQQLAQEKGQSQIDALHLLSVLLIQEGSIITTVLQKLGVDEDSLRKKVVFSYIVLGMSLTSPSMYRCRYKRQHRESIHAVAESRFQGEN